MAMTYRIDRRGRKWVIKDSNGGIVGQYGSAKLAEDALLQLQETGKVRA